MPKRAPTPSQPRSLRDSLAHVTAGFGSRGRAIDLGERWEIAVGPLIAAHSTPERLEYGRLYVAVDDPAWATELRYQSTRIVAALSEKSAGAPVTELHLRVRTASG